MIPQFYGGALVNAGNEDDYDEDGCDDSYHGHGTRASVISFFPWPVLLDQPEPVLTVDDFQARIEVAVDALLRHGLTYGDEKLDNIMLRDDGRIVFIDLEMAEEAEPGKELVDRWFTVIAFVNHYKRYLRARAADRGEPLPPAPGRTKPPPEVEALLASQRQMPAYVPPPPPEGRPRAIPPPTPEQVDAVSRLLLSCLVNIRSIRGVLHEQVMRARFMRVSVCV